MSCPFLHPVQLVADDLQVEHSPEHGTQFLPFKKDPDGQLSVHTPLITTLGQVSSHFPLTKYFSGEHETQLVGALSQL